MKEDIYQRRKQYAERSLAQNPEMAGRNALQEGQMDWPEVKRRIGAELREQQAGSPGTLREAVSRVWGRERAEGKLRPGPCRMAPMGFCPAGKAP